MPNMQPEYKAGPFVEPLSGFARRVFPEEFAGGRVAR